MSEPEKKDFMVLTDVVTHHFPSANATAPCPIDITQPGDTPPTDAQIAEWLREAEAATPGPWRVPGANVFRVIATSETGNPLVGIVDSPPEKFWFGSQNLSYLDGYKAAADRRFIASARTAVPLLCRELDAARGELKRQTEENAKLKVACITGDCSSVMHLLD